MVILTWFGLLYSMCRSSFYPGVYGGFKVVGGSNCMDWSPIFVGNMAILRKDGFCRVKLDGARELDVDRKEVLGML